MGDKLGQQNSINRAAAQQFLLRNKFFSIVSCCSTGLLLFCSILITTGCYKAPPQQPYRIEELMRLMEQAGRAHERGDSERAIDLYKEALKKARLLQDDRNTLIVLISLSRLLSSKLMIEDASEMLNTAKGLLGRSEMLRSGIPEDLKEELYLEEIALDFLKKDFKALSLKEPLKDLLLNSKNISIRIRALNLYARIEIFKERYEQAERYLLESLKINTLSLLERANTHRLLGELYSRSQSDKAELHLFEALRIDKDLALPEKIGLDMEILGSFYRDRGDKEKAREYLQRAFEIWQLRADHGRASKIKQSLMELEDYR
ncbi:MAG: hypothetical protein ACK4TF_05475 [Thermodesulfovibrionales bacterium]